MAGTLSITARRWTSVPWRRIGIAVYIGVNFGILLQFQERPGPQNLDWQLFTRLPEGMYTVSESGIHFLYSPLVGWAVTNLIVPLGYWPWFALHLAALWLIRGNPLLLLLTVTAYGFWADAIQGNFFVIVFVAGVLALQGSKGWALVSVALLVLMPRPVQLPLVAWLLWRQPDIRLPALGIALALGLATLATGQADEWTATLRSVNNTLFNMGPTALIGAWWFIVGLPLGAWLFWRGRVGWAGLAIAPYVIPQYFLMPLVERRD